MSDDSELVEKVARAISHYDWQEYLDDASYLVALISRQANEKMLRDMLGDTDVCERAWIAAGDFFSTITTDRSVYQIGRPRTWPHHSQ